MEIPQNEQNSCRHQSGGMSFFVWESLSALPGSFCMKAPFIMYNEGKPRKWREITLPTIDELIHSLFTENALLQATVSGPRTKTEGQASKVKVKPVLLRHRQHYQFAFTVGPKELHENLDPEAAEARLAGLLRTDYKQGLLQSAEADYQVLVDKKGRAGILRKPATKQKTEMELGHNRRKKYVLEEGTPVPFLVELGVMNAQGKVSAAKYDKFRQINRFLEMVADVIPALPANRPLTVIDFGCGKSYLTFALYHYLVHSLGREVRMTGLDLKADVIEHCSGLAERLNYEGLRFQVGDINRYDEAEQVDMVVTLHACDTATDAALEKAVRWNADVILSVPCCQHELFTQLENSTLMPMLEHGIIKERFAALATDSVRARLLELLGYKSQILEFIDMEHTPKNLLIRAVKQRNGNADLPALAASYLEFKRFLGITPYMEKVLADRLEPVFAEAAGYVKS
jgi:SAM-dependent methyltransferase